MVLCLHTVADWGQGEPLWHHLLTESWQAGVWLRWSKLRDWLRPTKGQMQGPHTYTCTSWPLQRWGHSTPSAALSVTRQRKCSNNKCKTIITGKDPKAFDLIFVLMLFTGTKRTMIPPPLLPVPTLATEGKELELKGMALKHTYKHQLFCTVPGRGGYELIQTCSLKFDRKPVFLFQKSRSEWACISYLGKLSFENSLNVGRFSRSVNLQHLSAESYAFLLRILFPLNL